MAPEFLLPAEVQEITRLRDPTRKRMEARKLFPRRIRIAPRRIGWRRTDIEAWVADPEGWQLRLDKPADPASNVPADRQPSPTAETRQMGDYFRGGSSEA
ncbi:MAG: AlpA family phage regulatory protein [Bradyrhizobium sp.]|uniref:AlpA family phage regulatory protein n=1 Tax=Bradyrhizobium sp. TaxID=376 RepID=UPI003C770D54